MLIDPFKEDFLDVLDIHAARLSAPNGLYLLIDGAFLPGLHKALATDCKLLLFATLPGCSDEAANASPFLTPYIPNNKRLRALLQRCSGWPMLSLIETPESMPQLAARLSAWCIVEADCQRFNFRFPDTRRLPAIFQAFNPEQRAQFSGPMGRWLYLNRDGGWNEIDAVGGIAEPAADPVLDSQQFAALVDDSRADEVLVLLGHRGHEVDRHPSLSHSRVIDGLRVAALGHLADGDVLDWCEWYWRHAENGHDLSVEASFQAWQDSFIMEK